MSEQSLKKILVALAVLVGLWGITSLLPGRNGGGSPTADGGLAAALEGLEGGSAVEALCDAVSYAVGRSR